MNEAKAIARLKRGDIAGLEVLVRQYQVKATRAAYLITQDRALAEDIVQTAFLRVYDRIQQLDSSRPFAPWFLRIVVNDAVKAAQRQQQAVSLNGETDIGEEWIESLVDAAPNPADAVEAAELRLTVWQALSRLSPEKRAAIVLRYYLELGEREMADQLAIPIGTVKWRLHAAREQLRDLLRPLVGNEVRRQESE